MSRLATRGIAAALVVVVGIGIGVAIDRSGAGASGQTDAVAPLSAADRAALAADRRLIAGLPAAFAEVPQAAADASGIDVTTARSDLSGVTALQQLVVAVDGQSAALKLLVASYQNLLDGKPVTEESAVPEALTELQAIEGDIVPAIRVVALSHGRHLPAATAFDEALHDQRAADLGRVLAQWSEIYGAFLLMEQEALS